ncbi:MAG: phosphoribosylamine--glycine ligase [Chloroflexi bacterium AL-N10]|nr:phosphoribosylamine--glycine ligase [Chloroflexi bacterium AL-N1]NOK69583.1 phosphoribosylamine--glycine ligase [Chloroflexi bacterium AL-N10]NOK72130.1 phosphoribosylamine--glycine ligase [Chloroflexi bacterium AL-N5]
MKVLLVGSGGREHALAWKLAQSPHLTQLLIAPGNPGTAELGRNVAVDIKDIAALVDIAQREAIDLVVVGPEDPLAAGLADACAEVSVSVFGPSAAAAQIESSKVFAKHLMQQAAVPTAQTHVFGTPQDAIDFVQRHGCPWVVKADGLASGKGVIVAEDMATTIAAIEQIAQSSAGHQLLLEERLVGPEVSLIALCDGTRLWPFPPAQDHKRLLEDDAGPNTGGMGAFVPTPHAPPVLVSQIVEQLIQPVVDALAKAGTPFRGALYAGVILTDAGPQILEFNARFGDPETQILLPLVEGDLLLALHACATGQLQPDRLRWYAGAAACVVLAAHGYPASPRRGDVITGIDTATAQDVLVFHAGTQQHNEELITSGGRVLAVVGRGQTLRTALDQVYGGIEAIHFDGMHYRRDIGRGVA